MHGQAQVRADKTSQSPSKGVGVSIVMPCLNESESLPHCVANAQEALRRIADRFDLTGEVLIADNGSTDGSQEIARSLGARVVDVEARGYGAALIGGFREARGRYLVMGDADGSYDFTDAVEMIGALEDGAELCMGSRFKGGIKPGAMPWKNRYFGNPALTGILNLFFASGISDAHCGLRAIRKDAYVALGLTGSGMEFASEMVIKASLRDLDIREVPATLSPDLRQRAPHLRPWRDGWRHLRYLFMLSPSWAFGAPAVLLLTLGLIILATAATQMFGATRGQFVFGNSWSIVAGFMITTGHIAAMMQVATHLHGVRQGYRTLNPLLERFGRFLNLEYALVAGVVMMIASILGSGAVGLWWSDLGFAPLPTTVPLVAAATLGAVGLQTVLCGVMLAVISGNDSTFVER